MPADISTLTLTTGEIALRLLGAMIIGIVIGAEREHTNRPAGMRTHMLVAIGSCSVMVVSQLIFCQYWAYGAAPDPTRLSAQVIAGVGFLGAGTILREGFSVKGLTTAASIWSVACLGIAMGGGYYTLAAIGTICIFATLTIFEWVQKKLFHIGQQTYLFTVGCHDVAAALACVDAHVRAHDAEISSMQVQSEAKDQILIEFRAKFKGRDVHKQFQSFFSAVSMEETITFVSSSTDQ